MARETYLGRKPLYPNGWPGNMRAVLYLQQKRRKQKRRKQKRRKA